MRSSSSKSILFLSDIHSGSIYAPCSSKPITRGTTWNPTKLQKKLNNYWKWIKEDLVKQPYLICINGEPIDGDNYKELGGSNWTTDMNEQVDDFLKLMSIYSSNHVVMTRGSGYHVLRGNASFEDLIASRLGAKPYQSVREAEKHRVWDEHRNGKLVIDDILNFEVNGVNFNVAHHIGYNKAYHSKTQALTAMLASLEFMRGKYWTDKDFPDVCVRGHVHYFGLVRFSRIQAFTEPCMKLSMDRYFTRQGVPEPPSLGAVEVIVESNGKITIEPHIVSNDDYPKMEILRL